MDTNDGAFLRNAFRALNLRELDAANHEERQRYVSVYDREDLRDLDPVARLFELIAWSEHGSASLFSGFRGSGKSTELLRLKKKLEDDLRAVVMHCDMHEFMNMDAPPDVPDLLLSTAGAFAEVVESDDALKAAGGSYWQKMTAFLRSVEVNVDAVEIKGEPMGVGLGLKLALKSSPTFQKKLQDQLASQVGALAREVHQYYDEVAQNLRRIHGEVPIVVIFDSLEHIKGTGAKAAEVAAHLVAIFNRSDLLRVPGVHVIYTVPPWLKVQAPDVLAAYDDCVVLPCMKVRDQRTGDPFRPGINALVKVVALRFEHKRLLSAAQLDEVILASGGYFRDLFRILQGLLRTSSRHKTLPATDDMVQWAIGEVRNSYLPLARKDACWLWKIEQTGDTQLKDLADLAELARLFDNHLVLTYRNGDEWYRAHPLIAEVAKRMALDAEP